MTPNFRTTLSLSRATKLHLQHLQMQCTGADRCNTMQCNPNLLALSFTETGELN